MARKEVIWPHCETCRHSAVIRPEILAKLADYDCPLRALRRLMVCRECGCKRIRISAHLPGATRMTMHEWWFVAVETLLISTMWIHVEI